MTIEGNAMTEPQTEAGRNALRYLAAEDWGEAVAAIERQAADAALAAVVPFMAAAMARAMHQINNDWANSEMNAPIVDWDGQTFIEQAREAVRDAIATARKETT